MLAHLDFFCLKFHQHFVFPFLMQNCPIYFTSSLLSCCGHSTFDHFQLKTKTKNSITVFLSPLINFLLMFLCLFIFTDDSQSYLFQAVSVFILMLLLLNTFGLVWRKHFYPILKRTMVFRFRY